jgi:DNA uptake protein ComE-like DNA-binding protein
MKSSKLWMMAVVVLATFVLMACGGTTSPTTLTSSSAATSAAPAAASPTEAAAAGPATAGNASDPTATSGAADSSSSSAATAAPATTAASAGATASANSKLNLNDVTSDQLLSTIPDLGDRMVREFFEYRPYISIQQFRREIGKYVSAEQVAAYEQYVYVPVDVDAADAATLQQLPGVDATIAATLIAGRPYGSNEAFLAKLSTSVAEADAKQAASYLAAK